MTNIRISAHFTHLLKFRIFFVFATEVTIFCYHDPLMYLQECAPKSAKLTRWAFGLQEFMHADSNIFHTSVLHGCAAVDKISTDTACSRGPSVLAKLLVFGYGVQASGTIRDW